MSDEPTTEPANDSDNQAVENVNANLENEGSVLDNFRQEGSLPPNMPPIQLVGDGAEGSTPQLQTMSMRYNAQDAGAPGAAKRSSQRSELGSMRSSRQSFGAGSDPIGRMFEEVRNRIEHQNAEINGLKEQLENAKAVFPQTPSTKNETTNLKKRIDSALDRLNNYYKEARQIQEKDTERAWPILAFATTLEEDNDESSGLGYDLVTSQIEPLAFPKDNLSLPASPSESQESLFHRPSQRKRCSDSKGRSRRTGDNDCDRRRLQEELADRDKVVERLHRKVMKMQAELARLCKERQQQQQRFDCNSLNDECNDSILNTGAEDDCEMFEKLNQRFEKIQKDLLLNDDSEQTTSASRSKDANIKRQYCELLEEYAKKDCKIQKLQSELEAISRKQDDSSKDPLVQTLRRQLKESSEENDAQRVIICEQSEQIDDYHEKYLEALQKNEELKCVAKRLQMDNRKVEDQINLEIKDIKSKFESRLAEYAQYPKLLENEQIKLEQMTKEKQELEKKLRIVCMEFRKLRDQQETSPSNMNACSNCARLQEQLNDAQTQLDTMRQCYNSMTNRFDAAKVELDTLRNESAKVICRLKERAEEQRVKLQGYIHKLEGNLAKARAAVSITSADKETTIKDMQGQLNCLALCLDTSQKQIKTLKDHIAYLNNGKMKSVVICCETEDKQACNKTKI